MTASADPAALIRLLISAGLKELTSKADRCEAEDREEMAESMEEVRGMTRWVERSPGMECIELTEDEADRSGSGARDGLGEIVSPDELLLSVGSEPTISGDCDKL